MSYDYTCRKCSHEFDYDDGVKSFGDMTWIKCPFCETVIEELEP